MYRTYLTICIFIVMFTLSAYSGFEARVKYIGITILNRLHSLLKKWEELKK